MRTYKLRKNQKGNYLLLSAITLLTISSIVLEMQYTASQERQYVHLNDVTTKKLNEIIESALSYHLDNVTGEADPTSINRWPVDINALYSSNYLVSCPNGTSCIPVDRTSWDQPITITPFVPQDLTDPLNPVNLPAKLRFSFDVDGYSRDNADEIGLANELASHYPAGSVTGTVVSFEIGRPGTEIAHDALLRKDGTTPLVANWTVGGFNIDDIGDASFTGYIGGGGSPVSVRASTFDEVGLYGHNEIIDKPTCPSGTTDQIFTSLSHLVGNNSQAVKLGAIQTYATETGNQWRVQIRYYTIEDDGTSGWVTPNANEAKALVFTRCG